MSTPFAVLYENFLSLIDDIEFLNRLSTNQDEMEEIMELYLKKSIPSFRQCLKLDSVDFSTKEFTDELSLDEIDILSDLMLIQYYSKQINTLNLMRQAVSNRDWNLTSQAEHLKRMTELRKDTEARVKSKIVAYTYYFGQVDKLK